MAGGGGDAAFTVVIVVTVAGLAVAGAGKSLRLSDGNGVSEATCIVPGCTVTVSPLTLGRCYWELSGELRPGSALTRGDCLAAARREFADALVQLSGAEVKVEIVHRGVGAITESDILLAKASGAIIIGFHVRPDNNARSAAEREGVEIKLYKIIYDLIEDVQAAMEGMLKPVYREIILGHATVRATFKLPRSGVVAGSYVNDGKVVRGAEARVQRGKQLVHTGEIDSLKHLKDDVREMAAGFECGILMDDFNDFQEGDVIEVFQTEQVSRR